jgi:GntR family transcriptional regulator
VHLNIQPGSGTPIYLQIMEQLKHAIAMGVFEPGEPIPTIREMALQAKVNPNTVAKAVRELERDGILVTRVGKGSFVNENAPELAQQDRDGKAGDLAKGYGKDMRWLGYNRDNSADLVKEKWEDED